MSGAAVAVRRAVRVDLLISALVLLAGSAGAVSPATTLLFVNANLVLLSLLALAAALLLRAERSGRMIAGLGALAAGELVLAIGELVPSLGFEAEPAAEWIWIGSRLALLWFVLPPGRRPGRRAMLAAALTGATALGLVWIGIGASLPPSSGRLAALLLLDLAVLVTTVLELAEPGAGRGTPRARTILWGLALYLATDLIHYASGELDLGFGLGELGYFAGLGLLAIGSAGEQTGAVAPAGIRRGSGDAG